MHEEGLGRGLRIVVVGGGTGLSTLLSGLKVHVGGLIGAPGSGLTAVVTVSDNGGSSGRLRDELNILPPGDIRNCMVALAEDERLMTQLFRYRFDGNGDLGGHSFGNLFLAAMSNVVGDFAEAVKASSEVLAIKGRIYPATRDTVDLVADLVDGRTVHGESQIVQSGSPIHRLRLTNAECRPLVETLEAIDGADLVVLGPGSLYSSVIPNLLVREIAEAVEASSAPVLYICNCMTQAGETDQYTVEDHLRALAVHAPTIVPDYVLVNTHTISEASRQAYLAEGAVQVLFGFDRPDGLPEEGEGEVTMPEWGGRSARLLACDVIDESQVVRHDPAKLTKVVLDIAATARSSIAFSIER